jgi:hypothetical protein
MAGNGLYRKQLAEAVQNRVKELMSRNRDLTELQAQRLAASQISKEDPQLLSNYRGDSSSM